MPKGIGYGPKRKKTIPKATRRVVRKARPKRRRR